jgi:hypothetical protein
MLQNIDKLRLIKNIVNLPVTAIYNDIESKWHYYVGDFRPHNPQSYLFFHTLRECKCIDFILINDFTFFNGDMVSDEFAIKTKIDNTPSISMQLSEHFKFVQII